MIRRVLTLFGYAIAPLLFVGARSPGAIVRRLRLAYRLAGVRIVETDRVDGRERTVFRCPYRTVGAGRYGPKWVCHDILDRVDDGYVTYLDRNRDVTYTRPRGCEGEPWCGDSAYCYSEVASR